MHTLDHSQSRRALLKQIALVIGATALSSNAEAALNSLLSGQSVSSILSPSQLTLVAKLADLLIPATDTPSAVQAGVPGCIEQLAASVFSQVHQTSFLHGLDELNQALNTRFKEGIEAASSATLNDFIMWLEQHTYVAKQEDHVAVTYREVKELVVFAYYTSEIGASKELHYQGVPGKYQGCLPLEQVGKTWATPNPF
jgi:gluconate 2-dehydrogenase gamma chain